MTVLLLLSLAVLSALVLWVARRHHAALVWTQELEVAFRTEERRELPRHRVF